MERVHRTSLEVKDFCPTPFDYISTDLDYTSLGKDYNLLKWSGLKAYTLEIKCWGFKRGMERVHRTSLEVKDFGPTPFDYISTDLDYTSLGKTTNC